MAGSHSRVSPSAASRWVNCPGSVIMGEQFPEPEGRNEAADEGTASHWIASETLEGKPTPAVGTTAPNGIVIDMEMIEGADVYVQAVRQHAGSAALRVEDRLAIGYVHSECFGTADCWYFLSGPYEVHIWDYKYGFGIVDPFENWQLVCYAAGVCQYLSVNGLEDQKMTVIFHIVQPRPFHADGPHRTWRVKMSDLRGHFNQLAHAANLALGPDPQCKSGDHCKYCSARHACSALQQACMSGIDYLAQSVPQLLSPEAMGIEKRVLSRIRNLLTYRETGLDTQIEAAIKAGGMVPGWALQQGKGRDAWTKPAAEIFTLGDMMGIDLRAEPEAVTPAAARKKGLPAELLSAYAAAGNSGVKIVPTDNSLASRVFRS